MNKQIIPSIPKPQELASFKDRDVPRFLVEKYVGMEQDIVDFLQSYYYYQQNGDTPSLMTVKQLSSADAQARYASLVQTGVLASAFEEATVIQLHEAQKTGWYASIGDIHNVVELIEYALAKQIEKDPTGGTRYEYKRLLDVMNVVEQMALNTAAKAGDTSQQTVENIARSVTEMAVNPKARRKMRESAKVVDIIFHSDADEEEKLNLAKGVFDDVGDPNITVLEFLAKNKSRMMELGKEVVEPVLATIYLLAGKELIVIDSPGEVYTRSIESALHGLTTEFGVSDPVALITKLNDELFTKGKFHNYQFQENQLVERSKGVKLPAPERFNELLIREIAASAQYIKALAELKPTFVPVYVVYKSYLPTDLQTMLCRIFGIEEKDESALAIVKAIVNVYPLPSDLSVILPKLACEIGLRLRDGEIAVGLQVSKEAYDETISNGSEVQT
jgi:hypothetical protein